MSYFSTLTSYIPFGGNAIKDFPYTIEDPVEEYSQTRDCDFWSLHKGKRTETGEDVSIFVFNKKDAAGERVQAAVNAFKNMKKFIAHPQMLKFDGGADTDDAIYIATEPVMPLGSFLDGTAENSSEISSEGFLTLGLHQVSTAVSFLNDDCDLVHGCLHPGSIYVNKAGTWKLGNFMLTHKFQEAPPEVKLNLDLLPDRYHPKELLGGFKANLNAGTVNSLDSWCMGCLIYEVYNGRMSSPQQLRTVDKIHPELVEAYRRLLQTKPQTRANVSILRTGKTCPYIAKNPAVRAVAFVDDIALKSDEQKQKFYKSLSSIVNMIPESCARYRILPAMLNQLQYGSGSNPVLLGTVLKLGSKLTEEEREKMIIPAVTSMFSNNERSTRINLLKHIKEYIDFIPNDVVEKKIFPSVLSGFGDTTPALREVSVRSLISFAPKLAEHTLNGKVVQVLEKCIQDPQPAIRTNTTVVIGEITHLFNKEKKGKVLAKAFRKMMSDKFVPARRAAVLAVDKNLDCFAMEQVVKVLIPALGHLSVDPYAKVRTPSLKCLKILVQRIADHASGMPDEPPAKLGSDQPKDEGSDFSSKFTNYASWAVSSVAGKITGTKSDDASSPGDDLSKRMGTIKKPSYNRPVETEKKAPTRPESSRPRRKKKKSLLDDDLDDSGPMRDDDFDFTFDDDEIEEERSSRLKTKKKRSKRKSKTSTSANASGTNPFEMFDAPPATKTRPSSSSNNSNPFDNSSPYSSSKMNNDKEDPFSMIFNSPQNTAPKPVDDPFADFNFDKKPKKRSSSNAKKKPKKSPSRRKGKTDVDDFFNSFN